MHAPAPLSTLLSQLLVAFTIELDNEFEHRLLEAGARVRVASLVMWSNFLRFVGDGIAVGELPAAVGLQRSRALSTLGGMERWRYVFVEQEPGQGPPAGKRDGYGSSRGLKGAWVVRLTPGGRTAAALWLGLFGEVEGRWRTRFGADAVDELRSGLHVPAKEIDLDLPEYLPIVGSANGMALDLPAVQGGQPPAELHLAALLARVLMAYTLDFERDSPVSLTLGANVVRVLDGSGVLVRDVPALSGISKEATSMALTALTKAGLVEVEGASASVRRVRLTPAGLAARDASPSAHGTVEAEWQQRLGGEQVRRLRRALERILAGPDLAHGLEPYPEGWRASKEYVRRTQALLADPRGLLPHHPMVLHRGGWPDGS